MPPDLSMCMWYTRVDPMSGQPVQVARHLADRRLQRALTQFFRPDNWFAALEALLEAGRQDLVGSGCDSLIPSHPPKEAIEARRRQANRVAHGQGDDDHYHAVDNPAKDKKPGERKAGPVKPVGYRPGRKTQHRRQDGKRKQKPK